MRLFLLILFMPIVGAGQLMSHSRGAAMGDLGIAAAIGNQTLGYNTGKTVFTNHFHQASVTYLPYLRALYPDTKYIRADYLTTIGETATLGVAINYLDLGNLTTRDDNGASLAIYRNVLYNVGGSIGIRLSETAGIGTTLRFLGARHFDGGGPSNRYGVSGDVQCYQTLGKFSLGAVVNRLGSDLWEAAEAGIGFAYQDHGGEQEMEWMVGLDIRKPLKGKLAAARYSLGAEIGFAESFFLRSGVSIEHWDYGNRKYVSLGAGYKGFVEDQSWGIDFHYQIPFGLRTAISPMQQAYGLTLYLNMGRF
nr:PorV/PorQ family protein [uncultured Sediminibacterium sp.]